MISLTDSRNNVQYSLSKRPGQKCSNCKCGSRKLYKYSGVTLLCELCNIVFSYSARTINTGIICLSEMSQVDIVTATYDFLKTNHRVPKVSEIDPDAKIIRHSFVDLIHCTRSCNKKQKEEFCDIKLFFTDMIDYSSFPFNSMFWNPKTYAEYQFFDVVNEEMESVKLTKEQHAIVNLYISDKETIDEGGQSAQSASATRIVKNIFRRADN